VPAKYFTVDGVPTLVHHTGPTTLPDVVPDLSRGEMVLCLHGAGGNGNYLRDVFERLTDRHSPLAFDQPGHGRSGGLDSLGSIDRMVKFTRATVDKLGLRAPVLLGHSMGGAVAQAYTLEHPEDVRALLLVASGASFRVPAERVEQLRRVTEGKERRAFTREAFSDKTPDAIVRRGWGEDLKTDPRAGYGDLLACVAWSNERLSEIRVPTLVVVGENEFPMLLDEAERLASEIPNARKVVIPEAGHAVPIEQPQAVADAILRFLDEVLA
jgi:pimeloyl-ACP methyl ester carboxylesterase